MYLKLAYIYFKELFFIKLDMAYTNIHLKKKHFQGETIHRKVSLGILVFERNNEKSFMTHNFFFQI